MNIQEHKPPLLNKNFQTIFESEFVFDNRKYKVYLKKSKASKNTLYAKITDGIVILCQCKVNGLHSIPIDRSKLEVLAYSAFAHYLFCEVYNA